MGMSAIADISDLKEKSIDNSNIVTYNYDIADIRYKPAKSSTLNVCDTRMTRM